jgi:hypothetical protein
MATLGSSVNSNSTKKRKLWVYVRAGSTRYAFDAEQVLEVADAAVAENRGRLSPKDLSSYFGAEPQLERSHCLVLDATPEAVVRVDQIFGIEPEVGVERVQLEPCLAQALGPAISGAVLSKGYLFYSVDVDQLAAQKTAQLNLQIIDRASTQPHLLFEYGTTVSGINLRHVLQVISARDLSPLRIAPHLLGATFFRGKALAVLNIDANPLARAPEFLVVAQWGAQCVAFGASSVVGVRSLFDAQQIKIVDLSQTISFS